MRSSRTIVLGLAVVAFLVFSGLPVLYVVASALPAIDGIDTSDGRQRALLFATLALGTGAAALATLVGAPLGFAMARTTVPFKTLLRTALLAPAVLPPYVVALAVTYAHGETVDRLPEGLRGLVFDPYSLVGAIVVLGIVSYPLSMLITEAAVRRVEPRLEEAAFLVASPARVLWRITGPLAVRNVLAAALLIFVLAVSEFSVPGLLRVRVYTTEVFTAFAALYDVPRATALALPLLALTAGVAAVAAIVWRERVVTRQRAIGGSLSMAFEGWRLPALAMSVSVVVVLLVLPLAAIGREAFRGASALSAVQQSGPAVINSLAFAAAGATVVAGVAVWLGYLRARAGERAGMAADLVWIVLFTVPSTVVGIGLIGLWNRPGPIGMMYGTKMMLLLGYLARFVPVAALILSRVIQFVPASHEEAAATAGATWLRTVRRVVLPQIRLGVAVVWIISFVLAFGEVGTSILIAPPGESTLPIRVYTLTANAPPGYIPALALFQATVALTPLVLLSLTARTSRMGE